MPGTRCCVAVCKNSLDKTRITDKSVSYHRFPRDDYIREIWVNKVNRTGVWNPSSCHICSVHFRDECLIRDPRAELLNISYRRKLKPNAIPTLLLNENDIIYQDDCEYDDQEILTETHPQNDPIDDTKNNVQIVFWNDSSEVIKTIESDPKSSGVDIVNLFKEVSMVKYELQRREKHIKRLEYKIQTLESRLRRAIHQISVSLKLASKYSLFKRRK